jgi:hypothetical protein
VEEMWRLPNIVLAHNVLYWNGPRASRESRRFLIDGIAAARFWKFLSGFTLSRVSGFDSSDFPVFGFSNFQFSDFR